MAKVKGRGGIQELEPSRRGEKRARLIVSTGYDTITGRYGKKTRVVRYKTKAELNTMLRQFVDEVESNMPLYREVPTFSEFAQEWSENRVSRGEISPGEARKQDYHIRTLNKHLGNMNLRDIDVRRINDTLTKLRSPGGSLKGKPLSGTTAQCMFVTFNQIMQYAYVCELIPDNPCNKVKSPKRDTKEKRALSSIELSLAINRLEDAEPSAQAMAALLAANTGMRRGEICALVWGDVDLAQSIIHVRHSLSIETMELKEPKTKSGIRDIAISGHFTRRLCEWADIQEAKLAKIGIKRTDETPIVASGVGGFMHPENLNRWWRKHRSDYGLEDFGLHQFRHTFVSVLISSHVDPKTVQSMVGHASSDITMDLYAHANKENGRQAADAFGEIIYGHDESDGNNGVRAGTTDKDVPEMRWDKSEFDEGRCHQEPALSEGLVHDWCMEQLSA